MSTVEATFIETEQAWPNEATTYWFELIGIDSETELEFFGDTYGLEICGNDSRIITADGCPLAEDDYETIAVRNSITVEKLLKDAATLS